MLKIQLPASTFDAIVHQLGGDARVARMFVDWYEERAQRELAEALRDQAIVSASNFAAQHRPINGVGQCTFRIAESLHNWLLNYASGYVYDVPFIKKLIVDNAHLCFVPTYQHKAAIIKPTPKQEPVITAKPQPPPVITAAPKGPPQIVPQTH
jgi:hypothetical protein